MNAFEVVVIVVGVVALVVALSSLFGATARLGRRGRTWFAHPDDLPLEERPSEDDRDDPLPRRPLRGRPGDAGERSKPPES
jgi:hypothetical protein